MAESRRIFRMGAPHFGCALFWLRAAMLRASLLCVALLCAVLVPVLAACGGVGESAVQGLEDGQGGLDVQGEAGAPGLEDGQGGPGVSGLEDGPGGPGVSGLEDGRAEPDESGWLRVRGHSDAYGEQGASGGAGDWAGGGAGASGVAGDWAGVPGSLYALDEPNDGSDVTSDASSGGSSDASSDGPSDATSDEASDATSDVASDATSEAASDGRAVFARPTFTASELDAMDKAKIGWGVKLDGHNRPGVPASRLETLERYGAFYLGPIGADGGQALYLTFDIGYENGNTASILDTLGDRGVPAAFFVTGHYISSAPELVERMLAEGHIVCNHTRSHKSFPDCSDELLADEIDGFAAAFREQFGAELARFVRPPNGEYNERSLALAAQMGWRVALWSFAYVDYDESNQPGEAYAFDKITANLHDGAVILLHATSRDNALALGRVIDAARSMGYGFARLDEIGGV